MITVMEEIAELTYSKGLCTIVSLRDAVNSLNTRALDSCRVLTITSDHQRLRLVRPDECPFHFLHHHHQTCPRCGFHLLCRHLPFGSRVWEALRDGG